MSKHLTAGVSSDRSIEPLADDIDGLDIHEGASDFPDITAQLPDATDIQQFGVRFEDAVKHMSVNKYASEASMIREYVANMAATCLDAQDHCDADYSPTIHIAYYPASETLIMEDNGMGMSSDEVESIGTQLGVSTHRYTRDRGGKYGIGLLSGLKGVGLDGAFVMHSRSRRTDETVKGLWTAYGFKRVDDLESVLEAGQYGTRFEFPLQEPEVDLREAITDVAQWSRIPVLYTERNTDGSLIADDEFGGRSDTPFHDRYSDTAGDIVIETDAFRAVHSPNATGATVLLDVPIDRNLSDGALTSDQPALDRDLPYRELDVVFTSEDQEIIAGPHEGLTRVSDGEYAQMPDARTDGYLPASECAPNDIWIPSPAGDRDRFEENPAFWRWLVTQLIETFDDRLKRVIEAADATDTILSLPREELDFLVGWLDYRSYSEAWNTTQLTTTLERRGIDPEQIDTQTLNDIAHLSTTIEWCDRGHDPWSKSGRHSVRIYDVLLDTPAEAEVWMAARPSEKKASVVWDDHPENTVVRVPTGHLDRYKELFGWHRLTDITRATLDEFDISAEVREPFERTYDYENPNAGEPAPDRELTLHDARPTDDTDRGYKDRTETETARYLRAYFEACATGSPPTRGRVTSAISRLILFPANSEETMSEYIGVLGHGGVHLANCAVKTWDYLCDLDRVSRIEDYLDHARSVTLPTSAGTLALPDARTEGDTLILHLVPDDVLPGLQAQPEMAEAAAWYEQEPATGGYHKRSAYENVVYAPVTQETLEQVLPILRYDDVYLAAHETQYPLPHASRITKPSRDTELYAYANLSNWRATTEYEILSQHDTSLTDGMRGVIDGFADLHDAGVTVPSQRDRVEGETYTTMLEVLTE